MATITTTQADDSIRDLYDADYLIGAEPERLYDQYATAVDPQDGVRMGATYYFPALGTLPIAVTAISQVADINPRSLLDNKVSITTTSRGDAIQVAELVDIQAYTDIMAGYARALGQQAAKSIDWYFATILLNGTLVSRSAARAALDAGTTADRLTDAAFIRVASRLERLGVPQMRSGEQMYWIATMPGEAYADLITGGNVVNFGIYSQTNGEIILNHELGRLGHFKIVSSPNAKVFGAAGADAASVVATTVAAPTVAGYSTSGGLFIDVAANTNMVVGMKLWIGTEETGATFDELMESVTISSIASTVIGVIGSGDNGGLLYDHPVGHAVRNADSVYPVLYGSNDSARKVWDAQTGEFGKMMDPKIVGHLDQWTELRWKYYGGVGIVKQNSLLRGEYSSAQDA